jgi:segregation and condensation protein B
MKHSLENILCAMIFASEKSVSIQEMQRGLKRAAEADSSLGLEGDHLKEGTIREALDRLREKFENSSLQLKEISGGFRLATRPEYQPFLASLTESKARASKLSQPALETLAIIAYRQPISRAEVEAVRGVAVGGVLETLTDRGLVRVAGRAEVPGRPLLYETTTLFLEHFGLSDLDALPNVEELRRVPLPEPPAEDSPQQEELPGSRNRNGGFQPRIVKLQDIRKKIDEIDSKILKLLNQRVRLAEEVWKIKQKNGASVFAPDREEGLLRRLSRDNEGPLTQEAVQGIFREILSASRQRQKTLHVGYLGPEGTHCHQAALKRFGSCDVLIPCGTIQEIFQRIERGDVDTGVVPIENSIEGGVNAAHDALVDSEVHICGEIYLRIRHVLAARDEDGPIEQVYSHAQALGQCRNFLAQKIPGAKLVEVASTAEGGSNGGGPRTGGGDLQ